jgi:hypothetical protein
MRRNAIFSWLASMHNVNHLFSLRSFFPSNRCGYDQFPGGSHHPIDGVLGLGKGKSSIVSQLSSLGLVRNVIGHCLSGHGGGFLFFGDDLYDSSRVAWTPMSPDA